MAGGGEKNQNIMPSLQRRPGEWIEIADPHPWDSGSSAQKSKLVFVLWTHSFQALGPFLGGRWAEGGDVPAPTPPFLYPSRVSGSSFPLSPAQSLIAGSPLSGMVNKPLGDINCQQELGA